MEVAINLEVLAHKLRRIRDLEPPMNTIALNDLIDNVAGVIRREALSKAQPLEPTRDKE